MACLLGTGACLLGTGPIGPSVHRASWWVLEIMSSIREQVHVPRVAHRTSGRRHTASALVIGTALAAGLSVWYVLAPPMGTDLSAQVAHADFIRAFGMRPADLGWYGGFQQFSYSLITPLLMAIVGARWLGALSAVVFTVATTTVMVRTHAPRPVLGGVLTGAIAISNLISGRTTFVVGLAAGACALAIATFPSDRRLPRYTGVALLSALASTASPIAGCFLALGALAWLLATVVTVWPAWTRHGMKRHGMKLGSDGRYAILAVTGAMVGLIPIVLSSDGGRQPYTLHSMRDYLALTVVVLLMLPKSRRTLRIGAALAGLMLVGAYLIPTSIGSNVLRLPMVLALPVVAAYVPWRTWLLALALAGMFWWRPPFVVSDLRHAGSPETAAGFYQPMLSELARLGPVGRIEVVPLRDHWESVYVGNKVPLARGWLRQVDIARNPMFYSASPLTPSAYADWLRKNAVSYVAMATGQPLDSAGLREAAIVAGKPAYLTAVWRGGAWTLYRVENAVPLVSGATLVSSTPGAVEFASAKPGAVTVRVRWSNWLTADDHADVDPAAGGWTQVRVPAAGRYTLTSSLIAGLLTGWPGNDGE